MTDLIDGTLRRDPARRDEVGDGAHAVALGTAGRQRQVPLPLVAPAGVAEGGGAGRGAGRIAALSALSAHDLSGHPRRMKMGETLTFRQCASQSNRIFLRTP